MNPEPDISVIIATHNRAAVLKSTLKHMSLIDHKNIDVEFVIVDNNSTDDTKQVILGFKEKLPIRYLFEPKPGQNYARNCGLKEAALGKIVVFTDDDIVPNLNWLRTIVSVSARWPQYNVFGGRIYPIWPYNIHIPKWTQIRFIQELGFAAHNYKNYEILYEQDHYPSSGNFWIRKNILQNRWFDNNIEWQPKNRIMATETTFFRQLIAEGQRIVHCPQAVVGHKITAEQLTVVNLLKRSYSWGRGMAHIRTFCRPEMLNKNPFLWYCIRFAAITRLGFKFMGSLMPLAFEKPQQAMYAMQWMGFNMELLNLAEQHKQK